MIPVHKSRTMGEHVMRAQRTWEPDEQVNDDGEIERLCLQLAALNKRIDELERQHPEASKIDLLRAGALALARQIDEIRCSGANDLTHLLAK
jgi:uncharacterized protein YydD (DUF2326 family)